MKLEKEKDILEKISNNIFMSNSCFLALAKNRGLL